MVVATSALIASMPGDEASVATAVQRFPDRFHGYFMFDPTQPELDESRECGPRRRLARHLLLPGHASVFDLR